MKYLALSYSLADSAITKELWNEVIWSKGMVLKLERER